jgi:hypothetical protein
MRGLQPARSDRLMDRQKSKGEKQRAARKLQEEAAAELGDDSDKELLPDSAAAIEPDK